MSMTPITFSHLQAEVSEWANRNFPNAKPHQSLLGVAEEVGELCHAHLKAEQGIRGTPAEHAAAAKDAVGDIVIYLCDYCQRSGIDLGLCISMAWAEVKRRDWVKNPQSGQ